MIVATGRRSLMAHRHRSRPARRPALLVACLAVLASGCNRKESTFPEEIAANFLRTCRARGGSDASCRCSLDQLEQRFTVEEYRALETRLVPGATIPEELGRIADRCRPR